MLCALFREKQGLVFSLQDSYIDITRVLRSDANKIYCCVISDERLMRKYRFNPCVLRWSEGDHRCLEEDRAIGFPNRRPSRLLCSRETAGSAGRLNFVY